MKELTEIRAQLDQLDSRLVELFEQRMQLCREVAVYKIAHGMPVLDNSREEQVLQDRSDRTCDESLKPAMRELFTCVMAISREEQQRMMEEEKQC